MCIDDWFPASGMDSLAHKSLARALPTVADMLAEFHETFYGERFGQGSNDPKLRKRLHREETRELTYAIDQGDPVAILRELADVVYVAYGTAHSLGLPLDAAVAEIHRTNMAKRGPDGVIHFREDGKVMKPPGWQPPDVAAVLREHGGPDVHTA